MNSNNMDDIPKLPLALRKVIVAGCHVLRDLVPSADRLAYSYSKSIKKPKALRPGDDWGPIRLEKVDDANTFWALISSLHDDNSGFVHNKGLILDAYCSGNLFTLRVRETDRMYERGAGRDPIFCMPGPLYVLPCLCVRDGVKADIVWTHSKARRNGFAKKLIRLLGIVEADNRLPGSEAFWEACFDGPESEPDEETVPEVCRRKPVRYLMTADGNLTRMSP